MKNKIKKEQQQQHNGTQEIHRNVHSKTTKKHKTIKQTTNKNKQHHKHKGITHNNRTHAQHQQTKTANIFGEQNTKDNNTKHQKRQQTHMNITVINKENTRAEGT